MSFTNTRNNIGPTMDPCGIPKLIGIGGDISRLSLRDCERLERSLSNQ
jgi:hypothetical protein